MFVLSENAWHLDDSVNCLRYSVREYTTVNNVSELYIMGVVYQIQLKDLLWGITSVHLFVH